MRGIAKRTYAVHCIIIVVERKNENLKIVLWFSTCFPMTKTLSPEKEPGSWAKTARSISEYVQSPRGEVWHPSLELFRRLLETIKLRIPVGKGEEKHGQTWSQIWGLWGCGCLTEIPERKHKTGTTEDQGLKYGKSPRERCRTRERKKWPKLTSYRQGESFITEDATSSQTSEMATPPGVAYTPSVLCLCYQRLSGIIAPESGSESDATY